MNGLQEKLHFGGLGRSNSCLGFAGDLQAIDPGPRPDCPVTKIPKTNRAFI
jgi:hypothetical protein